MITKAIINFVRRILTQSYLKEYVRLSGRIDN